MKTNLILKCDDCGYEWKKVLPIHAGDRCCDKCGSGFVSFVRVETEASQSNEKTDYTNWCTLTVTENAYREMLRQIGKNKS